MGAHLSRNWLRFCNWDGRLIPGQVIRAAVHFLPIGIVARIDPTRERQDIMADSIRDALILRLSGQPDGIPIVELPAELVDADWLAVLDSEKLVCFGRRRHCHSGPAKNPKLVLENGCEWSHVMPLPDRKTWREFLPEVLTETVEHPDLRLRIKLTPTGEVEASRLRLGPAKSFGNQMRNLAASIAQAAPVLADFQKRLVNGFRSLYESADDVAKTELREAVKAGDWKRIERYANGEWQPPRKPNPVFVETSVAYAEPYQWLDPQTNILDELAAKIATGTRQTKRNTAKWQEAQVYMDDCRLKGERFTSQQDFADRIGCVKATVNKAIQKGTVELQEWASKQHGPSRLNTSPEATAIAFQNTAQAREADPADTLESDDIDDALNFLLQQAGPEGRAQINAMTEAERRALAETIYQDKDREEQILRHRRKTRRG